MRNQWIVVADAADPKLALVERLTHPDARAHAGDLRTGGKGTVHDSGGHSQHQPDPQTTTPEKHADIFAKQLTQRLKSGLNDNAFESLVIAADPSFLGRLRDHLDGPLEKTVAHTIDKNWAQHDAAKIQDLLAARLDK